MTNSNDEVVVKPKVEARQGVTGHNVRYMLMIGTIAAAVALGLVFMVFVK